MASSRSTNSLSSASAAGISSGLAGIASGSAAAVFLGGMVPPTLERRRTRASVVRGARRGKPL